MQLIGIDPGASNGGIATYDMETNLWRRAKQPEETEWMDVFSFWDQSEVLIGIEKQQIRQSDRNDDSFFGIQKLVQQTERMTTMLRTLGFKVVEIHPSSWQSPHRLKGVKEESDVRKKRYQKLAGQLVGQKIPLWASDAVLIVYFMNLKLRTDKSWILSRLPKKNNGLFNQ